MEDRLLGDQYAIKATIGSGGMGVVYRAEGTKDGMTYAVKVLRPELARDENFLKRFRNEAAAVTRLSHPNIVRVYDVDMEADPPYIVMEYVEGRTLRQLIEEEAPLKPERAAWFAAEIAAGLAHAHEHGVIHRDVSPHNIKVSPTGAVKVMDFGLAHAADATTLVETRTLMGSVHYLAPEQARGAATDGRTDVYALGVLLHELVLGHVPFDGENAVSIVVKHLREPVPRPTDKMEDLPEAVEGIILRCLAKDPASRFPSAEALERECRLFSVGRWDELTPPPPHDATRVIERTQLNALEENHDDNGGGDDGSPPPPPSAGGEGGEPEQGPRADRNRKLGWAAAVVLLVLLGGGLWSAWNWLAVPIVEVPGVEGLHRSEAETVLDAAGLMYTVVAEEHSAELPVNYIISQVPGEGTEVRRGRMVNLVVSKGPELVEGGVPDVREMGWRQAELTLEAVGLEAEIIYAHHPDVDEGVVFEQNPRPGTRVQIGELVQLSVSEGPPPEDIVLPDWRGRHFDDVRAEIQHLGLYIRSLDHEPGNYPAGIVLDHDPAPDSQVTAGDGVALVVSDGCASSTSYSFEVDGPGSGPWRVDVDLEDNQSRRTVHSQTHSEGHIVALDLCWTGSQATIFIHYDGSLAHQEVVRPD